MALLCACVGGAKQRRSGSEKRKREETSGPAQSQNMRAGAYGPSRLKVVSDILGDIGPREASLGPADAVRHS